MLPVPASTSIRRPASESVRSVPSPTIRTCSAWSNIAACRSSRRCSDDQSSRQAPYRKSSNWRSVIPASWASAGVGNQHITHGMAFVFTRRVASR